MPYTVFNGAICQVTVLQRLDAQVLLNIFHYQVEGVAAPVDGIATIDTLNTAFNALGGPFDKMTIVQSTDVAYQAILYQWIFPTRYAYIAYEPLTDGGVRIGSALPANVAASLNRQTDEAGPHERGSLHVSGISKTEVTGASIAQAYQADLQELLNVTLESYDLAEGLLKPVLFNRDTPLNSKRPTHGTVQPYTRVLRRRTVGVGE